MGASLLALAKYILDNYFCTWHHEKYCSQLRSFQCWFTYFPTKGYSMTSVLLFSLAVFLRISSMFRGSLVLITAIWSAWLMTVASSLNWKFGCSSSADLVASVNTDFKFLSPFFFSNDFTNYLHYPRWWCSEPLLSLCVCRELQSPKALYLLLQMVVTGAASIHVCVYHGIH